MCLVYILSFFPKLFKHSYSHYIYIFSSYIQWPKYTPLWWTCLNLWIKMYLYIYFLVQVVTCHVIPKSKYLWIKKKKKKISEKWLRKLCWLICFRKVLFIKINWNWIQHLNTLSSLSYINITDIQFFSGVAPLQVASSVHVIVSHNPGDQVGRWDPFCPFSGHKHTWDTHTC